MCPNPEVFDPEVRQEGGIGLAMIPDIMIQCNLINKEVVDHARVPFGG